MEPVLAIMEGPDKGLVVHLQLPVTSIGRDVNCTLQLNDMEVSRRHAEIHREGICCEIVDHDSSNGTLVNGETVSRRTLVDGDVIALGGTSMRFRLPPPTATANANASHETQTIRMDGAEVDAAWAGDTDDLPELRRAKADLETLYQASRTISSILETSQILPRLLDLLFDAIERLDRCSIHLVDEQTGKLSCRAARVRPPAPDDRNPSYSSGMLHQVLRENRAILTYDAQQDERFREGESVQGGRIRSAICAPLQSQKAIIGIIHADTVRPEHRFTRDDLRLVAAIGHLAGTALENARLYERVAQDKAALYAANLEIKSAQEQLIQAAKLAAVGQMASGIVHDIKNPLTVVMGYTGLLRERVRRLDPDLLARLNIGDEMDQIEQGMQYCSQVVEGLLKFSRPSDPAKHVMEVTALVKSTVDFLQLELGKARIRATVEIEPNLPPIEADESQIKQVLINLLLNALQAMDKPEPAIQVRASRVEHEGSSWIRLAVEDNGKGMTESQRKRVFDPFFTTKRVTAGSGGSGLGLSISYSIIQRHGGRIEVESEPGRGSTFSIWLPVNAPPRAPDELEETMLKDES